MEIEEPKEPQRNFKNLESPFLRITRTKFHSFLGLLWFLDFRRPVTNRRILYFFFRLTMFENLELLAYLAWIWGSRHFKVIFKHCVVLCGVVLLLLRRCLWFVGFHLYEFWWLMVRWMLSRPPFFLTSSLARSGKKAVLRKKVDSKTGENLFGTLLQRTYSRIEAKEGRFGLLCSTSHKAHFTLGLFSKAKPNYTVKA